MQKKYKHDILNQEKPQYSPPNRQRNRLLYLFLGILISLSISFIIILVNKETTVSGLNPDIPTITRTILRSKPEKELSPEIVQTMLKDNNLFDSRRNPSGHSFCHGFEMQMRGMVVYDHACGLMWQQSGSQNDMNYEKTKNYISKLNDEQFAGYNDWRLPTLEEAMSLIEPTKKNGNLYIDPVFDPHQERIWTSDFRKDSMSWVVRFDSGYCDYVYNDGNINYFIRAVR